MNPELLLSIVNTLLRDKCESRSALANRLEDDYDLSLSEANDLLQKIGYQYDERLNQYIFKGDDNA